MIRFIGLALALTTLVSASAGAQPKAAPVTDDQMKRWVAKSLELTPAEQEAAFRAKMGELNAKFDPSTIKVVADKDGVVREVTIPTSYAGDIRPVALFRDLELLNAYGSAAHVSQVSDIECLRGLTKLKELNIGHTSVVKLLPLAELPIEKLYLINTPVTDITALKNKKMPLTDVHLPAGVAAAQLTVLTGKPLRTFVADGLGPDSAKDVKAIFGDAKLETYRVAKSKLEDLQPLAGMPLKVLGLGEAPRLKSLAPLNACGTLHEVSFTKAPLVKDLTPVAKKLLTILHATHCPGISDITPLKQAPGLVTLNLGGTGVNDLTSVAGLPQLERLWINEMQVKSLKPVAGLPKVFSLDLRNTGVADKDFAPVTTLPALKHLWLDASITTPAFLKKIPTLELHNGKPVANPK